MRSARWCRLVLSSLAGLLVGALAAPPANAHGLWGHIHVTGWAIENLPAGDVRDFFTDQDLRNAAWFGATYTDTGYGLSSGEYASAAHDYSEQTHWEPFIERFVEWIRDNDPPPWTSAESRRRVAFLMGAASHGLQDEIFDSIFLFKVQEHDGKGQDEADPGTDGFLALDDLIRMIPSEYVPTETLRSLYPGIAPEVYDQAEQKAVALVTGVYINDLIGPLAAAENGKIYQDVIPWARTHYMDPTVMGGHHTEIWPTAAYLDALWRRLHGTLGADTVVWRYPEPGRRLESVDASVPESEVTLVFGLGVDIDTVVVSWTDSQDQPVPFALKNTRWGETMTRLVKLVPAQDLVPGQTYRVGLDAGTRIDGLSVEPWWFEFEAACAPGAGCDPLAPVVADLTGEGPVVTPWDPPAPDGDVLAGDVLEGDVLAPGDTAAGADSGEGTDAGGADGGQAVAEPGQPDAADSDLGTAPVGGNDLGSAPGPSAAADGGCAAAGGGPASGAAWALMALALLRLRVARRRCG